MFDLDLGFEAPPEVRKAVLLTVAQTTKRTDEKVKMVTFRFEVDGITAHVVKNMTMTKQWAEDFDAFCVALRLTKSSVVKNPDGTAKVLRIPCYVEVKEQTAREGFTTTLWNIRRVFHPDAFATTPTQTTLGDIAAEVSDDPDDDDDEDEFSEEEAQAAADRELIRKLKEREKRKAQRAAVDAAKPKA